LTDGVAGISFAMMKAQIKPMQQPVRKVVGNEITPAQRLAQLEEMIAFLKKHAPEALVDREGDFYPVKKWWVVFITEFEAFRSDEQIFVPSFLCC
jgi:hypothetical protein